MNELHTFPNKNISRFFLERSPQFVVSWEVDGETNTQRGASFLSHIFFQEPRGANACIPLQAETPLPGYVSTRSTPDSLHSV